MIGIVTNTDIATNKDSDVSRVLAQVQILDEDVRTAEIISQHGEDVNPAKNCRAVVINISDSYQIIIAVTDDLTPEVAQGEKEIYSTDNPVTEKKARIKWGSDGIITINQGENHAAQYEALKTAFEELQDKFNNHVHPGVQSGGSSTSTTATPSTGDITSAEVTEVKLP